MLPLANWTLFFVSLNLHLLVNAHHEEEGFAEFNSIYNFILDLRNNSDNLLNYVSQIQAIFCPEQPICSGDRIQDRSLVIRNESEYLRIGSYSVKLEAVHAFVGVCCLPCSCEDICHEHGYCCLTKFLNIPGIVWGASDIHIFNDKSDTGFANATSDTTTLNDANVTKFVQSECITASVKSYINKDTVSALQPSFFMITHCFNESNNIQIAKCQNPSADDMNDTVPVTSLRTGYTYWNKHCAFCNNDIDDVLEWKSIAHFENHLSFFANTSTISAYPKTTDELHRLLVYMGDILYTPPFPMDDKRCLSALQDCEKPDFGEMMPDLRWLKEPCRQFTSPVQIEVKESSIFPFRNIFCFFCRKRVLMPKADVYCNSELEIEKDISIRMTALLDYKSTADPKSFTDLRAGLEFGNRKCSCNEIYDRHLVSFRQNL